MRPLSAPASRRSGLRRMPHWPSGSALASRSSWPPAASTPHARNSVACSRACAATNWCSTRLIAGKMRRCADRSCSTRPRPGRRAQMMGTPQSRGAPQAIPYRRRQRRAVDVRIRRVSRGRATAQPSGRGVPRSRKKTRRSSRPGPDLRRRTGTRSSSATRSARPAANEWRHCRCRPGHRHPRWHRRNLGRHLDARSGGGFGQRSRAAASPSGAPGRRSPGLT